MKMENLVACALLKETHFREDCLGETWEVFYIRNKDGREIDCVLTKGDSPLLMVEVKWSGEERSPNFVFFDKYLVGTGKVQIAKELKRDMTIGRGTETILVVEDEAALLMLSRTLLEQRGHRVLAASFPAEGIRLAKAHAGEIDLLVTDVVLPEMNGREPAKAVSDLPPGLKVLYMSGYTADVLSRYEFVAKGVQFLQKSFSRQNLILKVREALDRERRF